jgi:hypothetical protein
MIGRFWGGPDMPRAESCRQANAMTVTAITPVPTADQKSFRERGVSTIANEPDHSRANFQESCDSS